MYDVAVIGAGVVGGMIARELSRYDLKICIIEKENDVAMGATKANSAIVHAGFDAKEGSLKAKLNVKGSEMMAEVAKELGVKYKNNGSIVIAFNDEDRKTVEGLLERGKKNGVKDLRILEKDELKKLEPNISDNVVCALYAPTGAIICPYELTVAAIGNAMDNGAELVRNFEVKAIEKTADGYCVASDDDKIEAKFVINAAGVYSDTIAKMVGDDSFTITPRRGEYILLDKECGTLVNTTVFRTPSKMGKGILVSPTVDGNLLTGPTSVDLEDKEDNTTTPEGFASIIKEANENVDGIPFNKTITSFCGLRATGSTGDFIINSPAENFINVAGVESPGLSASPAIAEYVRDILKDLGAELKKKDNFNPYREPMHGFREMSIDEKNEVIKKDSAYGRIICRCETVTEAEFLKAIKSQISTVFMLAPNIDNIEKQAEMAHKSGKMFFIHIDLAEGIGKDEYGIKFAKARGVDGIISTRTALIKHAKSQGLLAVQRFFVLDSHSVGMIVDSAKTSKADMIELMPGTVTKVIEKIKTILDTPIVAGGLIETKEEIAEACNSGAVAVSTGRESIWN